MLYLVMFSANMCLITKHHYLFITICQDFRQHWYLTLHVDVVCLLKSSYGIWHIWLAGGLIGLMVETCI